MQQPKSLSIWYAIVCRGLLLASRTLEHSAKSEIWIIKREYFQEYTKNILAQTLQLITEFFGKYDRIDTPEVVLLRTIPPNNESALYCGTGRFRDHTVNTPVHIDADGKFFNLCFRSSMTTIKKVNDKRDYISNVNGQATYAHRNRPKSCVIIPATYYDNVIGVIIVHLQSNVVLDQQTKIQLLLISELVAGILRTDPFWKFKPE